MTTQTSERRRVDQVSPTETLEITEKKTEQPSDATPEEKSTPEKKKLFNLPQIGGGALTAITMAVVGSRFGAAGTILGAGLASVMSATISTLYTRGLERTSVRVKTIVGSRNGSKGGRTVAVSKKTVESGPARWRRPLLLIGGMVVTSAVTFVLAMGVVTGWEFGTGKTLDGRTGTTIGQVGNRGSSTKPTPSASASAKPTATPSASSTASPTATATPSAAPSATPTSTTTPTPSTSASETSASPADVPQGASLG